jgi:hypothetical protein
MPSWPDADAVGAWLDLTAADEPVMESAVAGVVGWLSARTGIALASTTVPDAVILAATMYAAKAYRRKDSPDGVAGTNDFTGVVRTSALDPDAEKLLELYVTPTIA